MKLGEAAVVHEEIHVGIVGPEQKIAAVSFLSGGERQLRDLIQSAEGAQDVQDRIKSGDGWALVQAMRGKPAVVHVMIDAGMTHRKAEDLNLAKQGVKLVFSQPKDGLAQAQPFSTSARWQPTFIVEMNNNGVAHVMALDQGLFGRNPMMPVF